MFAPRYSRIESRISRNSIESDIKHIDDTFNIDSHESPKLKPIRKDTLRFSKILNDTKPIQIQEYEEKKN